MPLDIVCAANGWLRGESWHSDTFDFWSFDRHVDALDARGEPLTIDDDAIREQVVIRTQRVGVRCEPWLARVLAAHRAMHDTTKPLVRADLDHALDAWQWGLRLDPRAGAEVQLATLLHDIERLISEADVRVEQHATDYQAFKDAHARAGASLARRLLAHAGVDDAIADGACALIATHERPGENAAIRAVNDADALSFFSLNSPGYLAYFGAEQTEKKVAYTLRRMSAAARAWLPRLRLPRSIRDAIQRA